MCDSDDDVELIDVEDEAREEAYFADATQPAEPHSAPRRARTVWLATYEHKHGREVRERRELRAALQALVDAQNRAPFPTRSHNELMVAEEVLKRIPPDAV